MEAGKRDRRQTEGWMEEKKGPDTPTRWKNTTGFACWTTVAECVEAGMQSVHTHM